MGGRGTTRSQRASLPLAQTGCRNLGRLNLRQLPLPHHRRTLSPSYYHHCTPRWQFSSSSCHRRRGADRHFRHCRNAPFRSVRPGVNEPLSLAIPHRGNRDRHTAHAIQRQEPRGARTCAHAACTVFSVAARLSPSRLPPALLPDPFLLPFTPAVERPLPTLPYTRARARARPVRRGGIEEAPLARSPLPRSRTLHPPYLVFLRHTHAHSRESIIVQNRELSYHAI